MSLEKYQELYRIVPCPRCDAEEGERCDGGSRAAHRIREYQAIEASAELAAELIAEIKVYKELLRFLIDNRPERRQCAEEGALAPC